MAKTSKHLLQRYLDAKKNNTLNTFSGGIWMSRVVDPATFVFKEVEANYLKFFESSKR